MIQSKRLVRRSYHMGNAVKTTLLFLISCLITVVALEAGLRSYRWFKRGFRAEVALQGDERKVLFRFDPGLGWLGKNNFTGKLKADEFEVEVIHNQAGFRTQNFSSKAEGKKRVIFLGDSSVWGWGIEVGKRISDLVAASLVEGDVDIFNLGIVGFGTDQKYLTYLQYGRLLQPDLVIIVIDNNDFSENGRSQSYGRYKPYYLVKNGKLQLYNLPVPLDSPTPWWEDWRLWQLVGPKINKITHRLPLLKPAAAPTDEPVELTLKILQLLVAAVRRDGARLAVVFLPTRCELPRQRLSGESSCVSRQRQTAEMQLGWPVIPVYSAMSSESARLYFQADPHLNQLGNEFVARVIAEYIEANRLL